MDVGAGWVNVADTVPPHPPSTAALTATVSSLVIADGALLVAITDRSLSGRVG
jgi:hypothetical protein